MHGLNEDLGRQRGREGNMKCSLCDVSVKM